jgi:hypothetical protein
MSMGLWAARLAGVTVLSSFAFVPVAQAITDDVATDYRPASQTLVLRLPVGVVPILSELSNPPRLVVDFTAVATFVPHSYAYTTGLVARNDFGRTPKGARITLTLRRALAGQYRVAFEGDRMVITLTPSGGYNVATIPSAQLPSVGPALTVAPVRARPRPTPLPIEAARPTARPIALPPIYATMPPVVFVPTTTPNWTPGLPTPRPHAHPMATPAVAAGPSVAPFATSAPHVVRPTPMVVIATPQPTSVIVGLPTPASTLYPIAAITPEPLPSLRPTIVLPEAPVFGSRLTAGLNLPLLLTESYPLGHSDSSVAIVPGGSLAWDVLFTPNFGSSVKARAISYTLSDQELQGRAITLEHRRDDYEANFGVFGRLPLPFGVELMAQPGLRIRSVQVSSNGTGPSGVAVQLPTGNDYMSSGWLGIGGVLGGGLGWHIAGPLALAMTGEVGYLSGGSMAAVGIHSIFPLVSYRVGGEARLDLGPVGLTAGYELGHAGHSGTLAGDELSQDWSGPTGSLSWLF